MLKGIHVRHTCRPTFEHRCRSLRSLGNIRVVRMGMYVPSDRSGALLPKQRKLKSACSGHSFYFKNYHLLNIHHQKSLTLGVLCNQLWGKESREESFRPPPNALHILRSKVRPLKMTKSPVQATAS